MNDAANLTATLRANVGAEPESGIIQIFNYGRHREGLIPLWVGEGDLPTPGFICDAAYDSLKAGETFYTYQRGLPELRQALVDYHDTLYGRAFDVENFFVTGSGMQAIMNAVQCVAGTGDEIIVPSPAWPNYPAAMRINGARPVEVPMNFANGKWVFDIDRLFGALTPNTKAIFVNSPSNPLGTVLSQDELIAVRDFARKHGIWLISDEVYARYYYPEGAVGSARAPSILDICDVEEQVMCINTFSKNWAMTGWRVGWMIAPRAIGQVIENLVQYNTSGVPAFNQRACHTAITQGESFVNDQVARALEGRELVCNALAGSGRFRFHKPQGAFYLFFQIDGIDDTVAAARKIIDDVAVGLAPGTAFGPGGEQFFRLCFARSKDSLEEAMGRLTGWVEKHA